MQAALFLTAQSAKVLVVGITDEAKDLFQMKEKGCYSSLLSKDITFVEGFKDLDDSAKNDLIEQLQPNVVILQGTEKVSLSQSKNHTYFEITCDIHQLDMYFSIIQLMNQVKTIQSRLNLN